MMRFEDMTRAEIDAFEAPDVAAARVLRPRDAATLILLDRCAGGLRVLMGRRHMRHAFMPGRFVFPGGRTDPADSRIRVAHPLHPAEEAKLIGPGNRVTAARARALALSAVRETYEETGILIGHKAPFATRSPHWQGFAEHGIKPSLDGLRYIARAITPPGRVRRFDTRFFAIWREDVALELAEGGPTDELEEIAWLTLDQARSADIPIITRTVLDDLQRRIETDPELTPGAPVPFYFVRASHAKRVLL
ncbi:NUDIX hydrolase [Chelativorans sp. M5D2P16]|uniref:NUDIX hydrolase n=1 Tax=Chelativorans sp. M5D2P16 TaxID=3095678 RepID=UPI002ACA2F22|nr:NUDIX domain-containing protein [Chelativorans sp. M5D2P16]MDZ5696368.1 NUDIX domain-containing protein [Chelativorans sp. M5D2P16]